MVISQTSSGCRHSEVTIGWEVYILSSHTDLIVLVVVSHAIVDHQLQNNNIMKCLCNFLMSVH